MTLEFRDFGSRVSAHNLNALLLVAAVELDRDVDKYGDYTPSAKPEFVYSLDEGVEIWLLKVFRPPQGYLSYGQLRTMITGLQIYLVLGKRPRSVRFRVLHGPNNDVLGQGAVGSLWLPDPPSKTTAKREFQLSSLNLNAALSSSTAQDSTSSVSNQTNSGLLTAQVPNSSIANPGTGPTRFKVPNTEMILSLTTRNNQPIGFLALQALLTGANNRIYDQIEIHGESAVITGRNFRYYLEDPGIVLEVLSWQSSPNPGLTWSQLAEVIEGLALFIVDERHYVTCYFNVIYGAAETTVGIGKIAPSLALSA